MKIPITIYEEISYSSLAQLVSERLELMSVLSSATPRLDDILPDFELTNIGNTLYAVYIINKEVKHES